MARTPEFDRNKALQAAMKLFWARGYTATSLADLLATMGIARSSFYASFGTKRRLFAECLELFGERTLAIVDDAAATVPASALAHAFFCATLLDVSARKLRLGCMMVNTLLELADVDAGLNDLAGRKLRAIESRFATVFAQAQQRRELSDTYSAEELAGLVMMLNYGLRVKSRQNPSQRALKPLIETSLSAIGLAEAHSLSRETPQYAI